MAELTALTLTEMQAGLNKGEYSSRELVQGALDKMSKLEPSLQAFLYVAGESALKQADEADKKRRKSNAAQRAAIKSPLLGIPVAIKDVLTVAGLPCTCGSKILQGFVSPLLPPPSGDYWKPASLSSARRTWMNLQWARPQSSPLMA